MAALEDVVSIARRDVERLGFARLRNVFSANECDGLIDGLAKAIGATDSAAATRKGRVYAARNVAEHCGAARNCWRRSPLLEVLDAVLGPKFGLVRVLFFDKPPEQSWSLPWHKDMTVAVREHLSSPRFSKPTTKAGVPHFEAPCELLDEMLTLRIHLDDVTEENGPLRVIPGSHHSGKRSQPEDALPETILATRGDVLAMRPLVAHASGVSQAGTQRHRRILHLEFSGRPELPDGLGWHEFIPGQIADAQP